MSNPPKLLDRMRDVLRARHYSARTEEAYVAWARRFILFHGKRHPSAMGPEEVNAYLTALATHDRVSAATQNQALCAILFLYRHVLGDPLPWIDDLVRARRPARLPVVLTRDEVDSVLAHVAGTAGARRTPAVWVGAASAGGAAPAGEGRRFRATADRGPRSEGATRPDDDAPAGVGRSAPRAALGRPHTARRGFRLGFGEVWLPNALARKLPSAAGEWIWQWVFPATSRWRDPATGMERRHHLHESAVQRAVRRAALESGIAKRVTCHTFRHSFAPPPPRAGPGHPHRAGASRTPRRVDHNDLHPCAEPRPKRGPESARPRVTPAASRPVA